MAVSRFHKTHFGNYDSYVDACKKQKIDLHLAEWNGELASRLYSLRDDDGFIRDPRDG